MKKVKPLQEVSPGPCSVAWTEDSNQAALCDEAEIEKKNQDARGLSAARASGALSPSRFNSSPLKPWQAYLSAVLATVATLGLRLALSGRLEGRPTLIIFTVPIMLSAYLGGVRAGLLATGLSYCLASYYLLAPFHSLRVAMVAERWDVFFCVLAGVVISALNEALHRARHRADIATRELQARGALVKVEVLQSAIFNSANFSCIATDEKGVIQIFNVGAERMLGYAAGDVVNKITPADISDPQEVIARATALSHELGTTIAPGFEALVFKASRRIEDIYELTYIRRDGSRFSAVVSVTALRGDDGGIIGYLLIGTDNTARRRAEEDRKRFFTLSQDVFCILGFDGYFKDLNPAWQKTLGYTKAQLLATPFIEFIHPDDQAATLAEAEKVSVGKSLVAFENRYHCKDGSYRWFQWSATPVIEDRVMYGVARDVTERKQEEAAIIRLAAIVESSDDAIVGKDLHGIITSWNKGAEKTFGYSAAEMVGSSIMRLIPADRQEEEGRILEKIGRGENMQHFETIRQAKDGRLIDVSVTVSPIKDSTGKVVGASKVARDITERKAAQKKATWLASFPECNPNPIVELDLVTGVVHYANPAIIRLIPDVKTLGVRHPLLAGLRDAEETLLGGKVDTVRREVAAGEFFFSQTITYIPEAKRVRIYSSDITERKGAEAKIRQLNVGLEQRVAERTSELEVANKELEAFSYSISHDLRAPLRAMNGFAEIVLEEFGPQLPEEGKRQLERIREGGQQMGNLIDDLLAFSRLSRQSVNRLTVDTNDLVQCVSDELKSQQNGRQIEWKIGTMPACQGDPALLKQVWVNLLSNAIKYTRDRKPAIVEAGCACESGENIYFVRDNGVGFDMRYVKKLFGVFQRLHRADEFEGTGVGLAIVQRIIHRHGGRIWAEAKVNQGAVFYFTIAGQTKI
jgi:PAS domain S-box-containing protein